MMRNIQCVIVSAILIFVGFLSSCAFGTREATLIYPPSTESDTTSVTQVAEKPASKKAKIVLKSFTDQRSDKKVVGTVRNGFGIRTADVVPTNSVTDWVMQAVTTELQNDGYSVVSENPIDIESAGTSVLLSGEILNVFCDMYFSYTGQVSLVIRVNKGGKELLNKHYSGEGSAGLAWAGTAESFAQSLALALSSTLHQFVSELDNSLSAE